MFTYLFFLTPELIYEMLPFSVLVAVLVQLGMLSKQNEITAFQGLRREPVSAWRCRF